MGEEGLDIGEVDLIICFDAHASPIRLVQRMGRTGRKRDGRIVILVTEGKEEQVSMCNQMVASEIREYFHLRFDDDFALRQRRGKLSEFWQNAREIIS